MDRSCRGRLLGLANVQERPLTAHQTSQQSTSFLDAFRGLAAAWVLVFHCFVWGGVDLFPMPSGGMAVDLFMVISGFLMIYTLKRRPLEKGWWKSFYIRRFFRIAPGYYIALALALLLFDQMLAGVSYFQELNAEQWAGRDTFLAGGIERLSGWEVLAHLTFVMGLFPSMVDQSLLPDWSLTLEMQFYAVFPVLLLLARTRKFLLFSLVLSGACIIGTKLMTVGMSQAGMTPYPENSMLLMRLPVFLVGMLIYEARERGLFWATAAMALLAFVELRANGIAGLVPVTLVAAMAALWLGYVVPNERLFKNRIVEFASNCSYAVYLFHGFALYLLGAPLMATMLSQGYSQSLAVFALTLMVLCVTYAVAIIVHRWIEEPGNNLGKRLSQPKPCQGAGVGQTVEQACHLKPSDQPQARR